MLHQSTLSARQRVEESWAHSETISPPHARKRRVTLIFGRDLLLCPACNPRMGDQHKTTV